MTRNRTGEAKMQKIVLEILNRIPSGQATIDELIVQIPKLITLTQEDLKPSSTRDGEALWEQIVRNIRSHSTSPNNYIYKDYLKEIDSGYKITDAGRARIKR